MTINLKKIVIAATLGGLVSLFVADVWKTRKIECGERAREILHELKFMYDIGTKKILPIPGLVVSEAQRYYRFPISVPSEYLQCLEAAVKEIGDRERGGGYSISFYDERNGEQIYLAVYIPKPQTSPK